MIDHVGSRVGSHAAGRTRVKYAPRAFADVPYKLFIGTAAVPRPNLPSNDLFQRGHVRQPAYEADTFEQCLYVGVRCEIIGLYFRSLARIGRAYFQVPARAWAAIGNTQQRSEKSRVGQECVSRCRSSGS